MSFNNKRIFSHIIFWVGIFLFYIFSSTNPELFEQSIETTLFKLPILMIAAYTFNYWQIPHYLKHKKYIAFGLSMIFMIIILVLLFRIMGYYHLDKYCADGPYPLISLDDFPFYMLSFHFPALIMYFYKTNKEQELEKEKVYQLEKEKIATELKYLKAQLNPHFLFNTLNNLYSYVITKSPKAPDMVLQLSEILDYILYRSQQTSVPLVEEIHTIENYVALERIKYGKRLHVVFEKNHFKNEQPITPLLLLSIVENAFKHGVRGNIKKPEIKITLEQFDGYIEFSVWNTKPETEYNHKTDEYKSGIGLANIQRQLDLIYPQKHKFEIDESDTFFSLKLTLKTN
ncbi:sensor histidine kinase [Aquimarina atlantica]|uniref:sensor histidine kinase n=1 Tax=Aquimarina atlantica TaxID=1317122 RepID=UPI00055147DA|nr:histidine kinase [Aquimarina atlantica]